MYAPILIISVRVPRADRECRRHRSYRYATRWRHRTCVGGRDCSRPLVVNRIVMHGAISPNSSPLSVVEMVFPVRVLVVMTFTYPPSTRLPLVMMMVADLGAIDVEVLNIFSLKSSLLKPLKIAIKQQANGSTNNFSTHVISHNNINYYSPEDLRGALQSHLDHRYQTLS